MSLFLLSKEILNFEKISFLPKMNGLFSLLDNAQVISIGVFVILTVIFVRYAVTPPPSIPQKCILGKSLRLRFKSWATDLGMMLQSAPVSTKKSKFWYPYFVKTAIEITGSAMVPNCVCFWPKGKSECINTDGSFGRYESDAHYRPVNMFLKQFFRKLGICFGMCKNLAVFSCDIFTGIIFLEFCIRDSLHQYHLYTKYIL